LNLSGFVFEPDDDDPDYIDKEPAKSILAELKSLTELSNRVGDHVGKVKSYVGQEMSKR